MDLVRRHPLAAITALAALLRLPTLAVEDFWYDEAFTAWLAGLPLGRLVAATLGDVHPPLWYAIETFFYRALGSSEFSLRLPAAIAGIALVPAIWRLAGRVGLDRQAQGAACLVTAIAPFAVYYSQEARPYSLLMLLCTLATIGLVERRYWLLVAAGSLALYLHNMAVLYVAALGWLALYYREPDWRKWSLAFGAIGIIWLPWAWWGLLAQATDIQGGFWVRPPNIGTPAYTLVYLLFAQAGFMALAVGLLAGLLLLRADWRSPLAGLVLLPLALAVIASVTWQPVLIPRIMAPIAPALYILIAPALSRDRLLSGLALATAIIWLGAYWISPHVGRGEMLRGMETFIADYRPGDAIYHANLSAYIGLAYYVPDVPAYVWPQAGDLSQSLSDQTQEAMGIKRANFEAVKCDHARWWVIAASNPTTKDAEREYMAGLLDTYEAELVTVVNSTELMDARLYLIEPVCTQTAQAAR